MWYHWTSRAEARVVQCFGCNPGQAQHAGRGQLAKHKLVPVAPTRGKEKAGLSSRGKALGKL
eukprot:10409069-Lingulodinium_polyedra.AAC.1